jgi:hypothetical protein
MTDDYRRYAIIALPAGPAPADAIAVGGLDDMMSYLPQTVARERREREADNLAMRSLKIAADVHLRADAVIERERQVKAQADAAQAIMSDAIHRFAGDVAKLGRRFDEIERQKIADALRDLPDPDAAPDDGDLEAPKPSKTEAEIVLGDQNPGDLPEGLLAGAPTPLGNYSAMGQELPQVPQIPDISLSAADAATPAFVCGRDRRAFMRRQRNRTWQR